MAKLTNMRLPPIPVVAPVVEEPPVVERDENGTIKYRTDILPLETWQDMSGLLDSGSDPKAYVEVRY